MTRRKTEAHQVGESVEPTELSQNELTILAEIFRLLGDPRV